MDFGGIHQKRERRQDKEVNMGWELGTGCPIKAVLEESAELGEQYVVVIRNLRKDPSVCEQCSALDDCSIQHSFNSMIDEVIRRLWMYGGLFCSRIVK